MYQSLSRELHRVTFFIAMAWCVNTAMAAPGDYATPVTVTEARVVKLAPLGWVVGTVVSRYQARLATEMAGKLVYVARVGTQVAANDVVAKIDPTFVKLRLEEYQAAVERDRARLDFLKDEVRRLKRMAIQGNASQTFLEQTRADREAARDDLNSSRARLKQAREEKSLHVIRAPFSGSVLDQLMRRGERAAIGDEVLVLVDTHALEIQASVPLATRDFVREGELVTLKLNGKEKQSNIRVLDTAGEAGLLDLRVALAGNGWTIGQSVQMALPTAMAKEVIAVPRNALVMRSGGAAVFRLVADAHADNSVDTNTDKNASKKVERIAVQPGVASGTWVEVIGDIKAGDRIVTHGSEALRPGAIVSILDADQAGSNVANPVVDKYSEMNNKNNSEK